MTTLNEQMTRRPSSANRLRDFLVMAIFSLAALVAAFAVVQYLHAGRAEPAPSTAPAETAALVAPQQAESARGSILVALAPATAVEAEARSELRIDLQRVRGELEVAMTRISELEQAVRELEASPTRDPQPAPEARAISEAKPSASSDAAPAAQPTGDDGNGASKDDAPRVQAEDVAPNPGETMRYVVRSGDTAAKIAQDHCLSLPDLLRLNPDVRNPDALGIRQVLAVEDRCVSASKERAAAD